MWKALSRFFPVLLWAALGLSAPPANLSGDWHLNVERSRWGQMPKPHSVVLHIEHKDPALHYTGEVVYANEDTRDFAFDGAFDGKPYGMSRSFGHGMIVLKRVDLWTFESVMTSDNGEYVESARTSLSQDGRTMTRRLELRSPDGTKRWTEVYEKR